MSDTLLRSVRGVSRDLQGRPWAQLKGDGSVLRFCSQFPKLNYAPVVFHEITHFTHADPDVQDDYGRDRFVTLHQFVLPRADEQLVIYEVSQYTNHRHSAPRETEWSIAVRAAIGRLRAYRGAQVFRREFICDDEEHELRYRLEIAPRDRD